MFRIYALFAMTVLALEGARDLDLALRAGSRRPARTWAVLAALWASLATLALSIALRRVEQPLRPSWAAAFVLEWGGVLALALTAALARPRLALAALTLLVPLHACADGLLSLRLGRPVVFQDAKAWRAPDAAHDPRPEPGVAGWSRRLLDPSAPDGIAERLLAGDGLFAGDARDALES